MNRGRIEQDKETRLSFLHLMCFYCFHCPHCCCPASCVYKYQDMKPRQVYIVLVRVCLA
jgi:hypothetical protein